MDIPANGKKSTEVFSNNCKPKTSTSSSRKSSMMKRSKSFHYSKNSNGVESPSIFSNGKNPAHYARSALNGSITRDSIKSSNNAASYANRRHHSTNDYFGLTSTAYNDDGENVLNFSSSASVAPSNPHSSSSSKSSSRGGEASNCFKLKATNGYAHHYQSKPVAKRNNSVESNGIKTVNSSHLNAQNKNHQRNLNGFNVNGHFHHQNSYDDDDDEEDFLFFSNKSLCSKINAMTLQQKGWNANKLSSTVLMANHSQDDNDEDLTNDSIFYEDNHLFDEDQPKLLARNSLIGGHRRFSKSSSSSSVKSPLNHTNSNHHHQQLLQQQQQSSYLSKHRDSQSSISSSISLNNFFRQLPNPMYRFYIIKQRNYPPLFLENDHSNGEMLPKKRRIYRILVLGYPSSGKTSLIKQFYSSLTLNKSSNNEDEEEEEDENDPDNDNEDISATFNPANVEELNERNNLLIHFLESDSFDKYLLQMPVTDYQPDVYLILFSVNNRDSFNSVKKTLTDLQRWDDLETKSIIIVANKSDLARSRCIKRKEGRELASTNNCKYIEVSCSISHNIDVLLQGIGSQICLKEQQQQRLMNEQKTYTSEIDSNSKLKRKPSFFKRILRKTAINKSKSCDNLHVL